MTSRKSRGIPFKMVLGALFFGVIMVLLGLVGAMQLRFVERNSLDQTRAHALEQVGSIALMLQPDIMSGFYPAVVQRANRMLQMQPDIVGLTIVMRNGYPVLDQPPKGANRTLMLSTKVYASTLAGQNPEPDDWIGSLTVWYSLEKQMAMIGSQRRVIALFGVAMLLAALGLSAAVAAAVSRPIQRLAGEMNSGDLERLRDLAPGGAERISELSDLYAKTHQLAAQNLEYQAELVKRAKEAALAEFARQVAHDIRSPAAALSFAVDGKKGLLEEERKIIRTAAARIQDIANDLLERYRQQPRSELAEALESREPAVVQLVSTLIDPVITEKRLGARDKTGATIEYRLDGSSYGLFCVVQPTEFKRALSNLISNGVEALEGAGSVVVRVEQADGNARIRIEDSGKGIPPELLPMLGKRGVTHGKAGGSGLGLHHARGCAERWGGRLELSSKAGRGTVVTIELPKALPPAWFVPRLELPRGAVVVAVDDDPSIHRVWEGRLRASDIGVELVHCSSPDELRAWIAQMPDGMRSAALFLIDHEFLGRDENGLELIDALGISERAILVTSRFEEAELVRECARRRIRLIPKMLAGFVPISSEAEAPPETVLIDDDPLVRLTWQTAARSSGRRLSAFASHQEFLAAADRFPAQTPIYLDSDLGGGVRGETLVAELHARGFSDIYLATGRDPVELRGVAGLKGIRGKEPPWA